MELEDEEAEIERQKFLYPTKRQSKIKKEYLKKTGKIE
jgi:hypothetical protein